MAKKALGKGLGALFPEEDFKKDVIMVESSNIRRNPYQPREDYSDSEIESLVDSISNKGIIQPIVVRKKGKVYEVVCGERRYRAAKKAGLKKVPVIIKDLTDREVLELALVENLQRKDLNPIEEANAYDRLIKEFGLTQSEIAKVVSKKRTTVANRLRLLKLPRSVKSMVMREEISEGHARALLSLDNETSIISLANEIKRKGLSVRNVESLIRKRGKIRKKSKKKDPFSTEVERLLREKFGTKCTVKRRGEKGNIAIDFYSEKDLNRILEILNISID